MLHRVGLLGRVFPVAGLGQPPSLDLSFATPGTLPANVTFTRASTASYVDASGVMQIAAANTPRWDYDPVSHALNGLLIEEARTNVLLNSAALVTQSVTTTAVATTLSFTGTGTVTLSGTSTAGPLTGTGAGNRVALAFTPTAGTLTLTVAGSVTNAQLEAGTYQTSYIPTAGASATRAAEACSLPTAAWFNAAASSLALDYMIAIRPSPSPPARDALSLSDGTLANRFTLRGMNAGGGPSIVGGAIANVSTFTTGLGLPAINVPWKLAAAYSGTTVIGSLNGGAVVSQAMGMPAGLNVLTFGYDVAASAGYLNGWIRRVRYWPRALGSIELQSVTA